MYRAGIVLQAYVPDSATVQRELTAWAMQRLEARRCSDQSATGQRRQPGDGTRRSGMARLAPGALSYQS